MENLTFEQLPEAVTKLTEQVSELKQLLLNRFDPFHNNSQDELLTIQQAAEFLCLSVPTIYGLVSKAEIPVSKKGKRLYFSKQELSDWIKAGRKKTNAEIATEATNYIKAKAK